MHDQLWMMRLLIYLPGVNFTHTAAQFSLSTVIVSAESVDDSTPGVRVTWCTTVPPDCVTFVRVEFRTSRFGPVVATYTTTNTSQTEVIQTGLQCGANYYTRVVVTGELRLQGGVPATPMLSPIHPDVQVLVGGKSLKKLFCMLILITAI